MVRPAEIVMDLWLCNSRVQVAPPLSLDDPMHTKPRAAWR